MAERIPSIAWVDSGAMVITWRMFAGDTARAYQVPLFPTRSVQIDGTPSGATVAIQGTLYPKGVSPETFVNLSDSSGGTLTGLSTGLKGMRDHVVQVKPVLTGGDASTDLTIQVFASTVARG